MGSFPIKLYRALALPSCHGRFQPLLGRCCTYIIEMMMDSHSRRLTRNKLLCVEPSTSDSPSYHSWQGFWVSHLQYKRKDRKATILRRARKKSRRRSKSRVVYPTLISTDQLPSYGSLLQPPTYNDVDDDEILATSWTCFLLFSRFSLSLYIYMYIFYLYVMMRSCFQKTQLPAPAPTPWRFFFFDRRRRLS